MSLAVKRWGTPRRRQSAQHPPPVPPASCTFLAHFACGRDVHASTIGKVLLGKGALGRLEHANNAYNQQTASTCGRPRLQTRPPSRVHGQTLLAKRIWGRGPAGPFPNIVTWRLQHADDAYYRQIASTCGKPHQQTRLPSCVHGQTPLANRFWGSGPSGPFPNIVTWHLEHADNAYNQQSACTCERPCLQTRPHSRVHGQTPLANCFWGSGPSGPFPNIVTWRLEHADIAYNLQTAPRCGRPRL